MLYPEKLSLRMKKKQKFYQKKKKTVKILLPAHLSCKIINRKFFRQK